MRPPRLLVISEHYHPELNFITAGVAEAMATDFEVTVVTAYPNYPMGRFFSAVPSLLPARSVEGGVTVWRLPLVPYHGNSVARRGLMYLSFAVVASLVAPFVAGRPAVVWVYQTPFTSALAALWFKAVYRARLAFTAADLWPESLLATNVARPGLLIRSLYTYRRWINRQADAIIASTHGTERTFAAEGIPGDRLHYVPVWTDGIAAGGAPPAVPTRSLVYAGNLGPAQRLDTLVRGAARLRDLYPGLTVDLYGTGSAEGELRGLAASLGATNVRFLGKVTPEAAFAASRQALAQVVSLRKTPLFAMTVPSKLAFCFAAGSPVLAGLVGEAADVATESGGALAFDSDDPDSFVSAVGRLMALNPATRQAMSERMRAFYDSSFSRESLLKRYRTILQALAGYHAVPTARVHSQPGEVR